MPACLVLAGKAFESAIEALLCCTQQLHLVASLRLHSTTRARLCKRVVVVVVERVSCCSKVYGNIASDATIDELRRRRRQQQQKLGFELLFTWRAQLVLSIDEHRARAPLLQAPRKQILKYTHLIFLSLCRPHSTQKASRFSSYFVNQKPSNEPAKH